MLLISLGKRRLAGELKKAQDQRDRMNEISENPFRRRKFCSILQGLTDQYILRLIVA
jgi:hypothetical protein